MKKLSILSVFVLALLSLSIHANNLPVATNLTGNFFYDPCNSTVPCTTDSSGFCCVPLYYVTVSWTASDTSYSAFYVRRREMVLSPKTGKMVWSDWALATYAPGVNWQSWVDDSVELNKTYDYEVSLIYVASNTPLRWSSDVVVSTAVP